MHIINIYFVINVRDKVLIKRIGSKVRSIRLERKLSQEMLSYKADVPISQIGRIERGEINPTISSLFVIATALDVELKELVDVSIEE